MKQRRIKHRSPKSIPVQNDINVMPDGMLEAVTPTDLAILSVAIHSPEVTDLSRTKNQHNKDQ